MKYIKGEKKRKDRERDTKRDRERDRKRDTPPGELCRCAWF
jgi:hypothetical protein